MNKEQDAKEFYDNIASNYSGEHKDRFADKILEHFMLAEIPIQKNLKILDLGSGIGRFAKPLLERGHEVTLVEISMNMLNESKKELKNFSKASFHVDSATNLSQFKENSFDVVLVMNAILDYCGDYKKALNEIYRILKEKGILMGNVNNRFIYCRRRELKEEDYDLFEKNMFSGDRYICWAEQKKGHVSHEFTLDELKDSLIKSKFKIKKILGVFNLLDKYDLENVKNKNRFLKLQIEFAEKEEYINNSQDFFFVAEK